MWHSKFHYCLTVNFNFEVKCIDLYSDQNKFQDLLLFTGPCPRPENMTKGQLIKELHERGLTDTGTVQQWMERIRNDDRRKIKTC